MHVESSISLVDKSIESAQIRPQPVPAYSISC